MRITFLAVFFMLVAGSATADELDNVVTNLESGWTDNDTRIILMSQTASTEDVLQKVFGRWWFYTSDYTNYIQITNFTILKTRQIAIPVGSYPGAREYSYTAVLVQASQGIRVVVLLRYFDVYTSRAWLSAVFEVNPPPKM